MGLINTGSFAKALWPGQQKWFGESYDEWTPEYPGLYEEKSSTRAYEEITGVSTFGLAREKTEGQPGEFDEASQTYTSRFINRSYFNGYAITLEAMEDNQYDLSTLGKDKAKALAFSMRQTREILAANVYNRHQTAGYTGGDGVVLSSLLHPLKGGGTFANTLTVAADLSEASLEQAYIDIAGFVNERGFKISILPQALIIPKELAFEAHRILKSTLQNDSANNADNALRSMGAFPTGVKVNHYLTDSDAWFIRTNCPNGMIYQNRMDTKFEMDNDFSTKNALFSAMFRCSFGWADPRGFYSSPGA